MYLRKKTIKGIDYYYVIDSEGKKRKQYYLGSLHKLLTLCGHNVPKNKAKKVKKKNSKGSKSSPKVRISAIKRTSKKEKSSAQEEPTEEEILKSLGEVENK